MNNIYNSYKFNFNLEIFQKFLGKHLFANFEFSWFFFVNFVAMLFTRYYTISIGSDNFGEILADFRPLKKFAKSKMAARK